MNRPALFIEAVIMGVAWAAACSLKQTVRVQIAAVFGVYASSLNFVIRRDGGREKR